MSGDVRRRVLILRSFFFFSIIRFTTRPQTAFRRAVSLQPSTLAVISGIRLFPCSFPDWTKDESPRDPAAEHSYYRILLDAVLFSTLSGSFAFCSNWCRDLSITRNDWNSSILTSNFNSSKTRITEQNKVNYNKTASLIGRDYGWVECRRKSGRN